MSFGDVVRYLLEELWVNIWYYEHFHCIHILEAFFMCVSTRSQKVIVILNQDIEDSLRFCHPVLHYGWLVNLLLKEIEDPEEGHPSLIVSYVQEPCDIGNILQNLYQVTLVIFFEKYVAAMLEDVHLILILGRHDDI